MTLTAEQVQRGVLAYADAEIGQNAVGLQKFVTYFAIAAFKDKLPKMLISLKNNPIVQSLDIYNANGNINIDELYKAAKFAIEKSGSFQAYGIIFNESDIDKLYEYLKKAGSM